MMIRKATINDLEAIAKVEDMCFPQNEGATKEIFIERLKKYANHFWLLFENKELISFIDGMVTDIQDLQDEMYEDASMHDEQGDWQMIFGVNTIPPYQHQGYATTLMNMVIEEVKKEDRKGIVLTCKEHLIPFYERFHFINEGISKSVHGDVTWYQMRLVFEGEEND